MGRLLWATLLRQCRLGTVWLMLVCTCLGKAVLGPREAWGGAKRTPQCSGHPCPSHGRHTCDPCSMVLWGASVTWDLGLPGGRHVPAQSVEVLSVHRTPQSARAAGAVRDVAGACVWLH